MRTMWIDVLFIKVVVGIMVPTRSSHLVSHPEGELMPLSKWSTRDSTVGLSRLTIMRRWKRDIYKRLGYLVT